eukprot:m.42496 g.42496  ORF g.42496 m.42496 type:complete len:278 (-) comp9886_c0_seq2:175-1008(-)
MTNATADNQEHLATVTARKNARYKFDVVDYNFPPFSNRDTLELLNKWSMRDSMGVYRFKFDQKFTAPDMGQFVEDFLNDENVIHHFKILCNTQGSWTTLGQAGKCTKVTTSPVNCEATSMAFFDRLYECGAIRKNGHMCGCFPEYLDNGFTINQEVGKVILMEDSDHYDMFSSEERQELLFRIFQHLTLGGPLNQYEDEVGPYFDTVKAFYKSLVSVGKDPKSGDIKVNSMACKLEKTEGLLDFFPQSIDHPQNFCYLIINPIRREATIWYYAWCGN